MKLLIIILILFSINCFLNEKEKRRPTRGDIFNFCGLGFFLTEPSAEFKAQDNNDGTLSYTKITTFGSSLCGTKRSNIENIFVVKKCIQGQVYRKEQNDCKGTGNASNYYGATLMQYCAVVNQCNNGNSIPELSCRNEKINSLDWDVALPSELNGKYKSLLSVFVSRKDEIPSGINDYYWVFYQNLNAETKYSWSQLDLAYALCRNN